MNECPKCKSSWIGDPIPEDLKQHYSGNYWKREIGIDGGRMGIYDGVVAYRCPDCQEDFPRNDSTWALEMFKKYRKYTEDGK